MIWTIKWTNEARKQLRRLDKPLQKDILHYMSQRIATSENPHDFGKPLNHDKYGLWRYRVRDTRIICQIWEEERTIIVARVGHRKNVYSKQFTTQ
ncbi:MAG: type II toxin-antitoxin system RelE/ParE family toxin [Gammaproteobacteria bacterium]|nr:type II toxin-antitoxin system RelE/ParE family toxin [Gammaproteobacteria bacterium]